MSVFTGAKCLFLREQNACLYGSKMPVFTGVKMPVFTGVKMPVFTGVKMPVFTGVEMPVFTLKHYLSLKRCIEKVNITGPNNYFAS